jgi:hypothetical protein
MAAGGDLSKGAQRTIKQFEKVMGKGSASADSLTEAASTLTDSAATLKSDDLPANLMSKSDYADDPSPMRVVVRNRDTKPLRLEVNAGHRFKYGKFEIGHGSIHAARRFEHGQVGGVSAYKNGTDLQRKAYRNLPFPQNLQNPDHLMDMVY